MPAGEIEKMNRSFLENSDKKKAGNKSSYMSPESHSTSSLPSGYAAAQDLKNKPETKN